MILLTQNLTSGSGYATPDLKYTFENGTNGVLLAAGDTPAAGDTAFASVTTNTGSGGVYAYANDFPAHGSLGVKIQTVATAVSNYGQWDITGSGLSLYGRLGIYLPTGTTFGARFDFWQPRDSATRFRCSLSTSRQLQMLNGSTVVATSTNTLSLDTQYRVEMKCIIDASAGILEAKFFVGDSETAVETITANGLNTGTTECTNIRIGNPFATANLGPLYMDDFGISYTGYMGPATTATTHNADASATATFTGTAAATVTDLADASATATFAGAATATVTDLAAGTGTATFAGTATATVTDLADASATATLAGTATAASTKPVDASATVTFGATADATTGIGGADAAATLTVAGTSTAFVERVATATGTATVAGTATAASTKPVDASATVTAAGTGTVTATRAAAAARPCCGSPPPAPCHTSSGASRPWCGSAKTASKCCATAMR